MMEGNSLIWLLALFTLVAVVAVALWQRKKASDAKDQHKHSALTAGRPDLRRSDGADPGTKPQ